MAHCGDSSPLGQKTAYVSVYDAGLLFPIARRESRALLGIATQIPFYGCDVWTGYEISWLNEKGKPQVAVAEFSVPCDSEFIIESKSLKLYLNSFNQTKFSGLDSVKAILAKDLSAVAGKEVRVVLQNLGNSTLCIDCTFNAICIDDLDVDIASYHPEPALLIANKSNIVTETLCSHLLKSNCPVTGQPDWASLFIEYSGAKIDHHNLLKYVVSFREHQDFHEHCVERIFFDLVKRCEPESLSVYARYTRRGGLDINPFRSTEKNAVPQVGRLLRQ